MKAIERVGQMYSGKRSYDIHIPERSFLRGTINDHGAEYTNLLANLLPRVMLGKLQVKKMLDFVGLQVVSDVKKRIREGIPPENAPSVLAAKVQKGLWNANGKAQKVNKQGPVPLIDTGQNLLNRITHLAVLGGSKESEDD